MKLRRLFFVACTALLCASSMTFGQTTWNEVGDAPEGVPARQDTVGTGPLFNIEGTTDSAVGDFRDTYSIIITNPDQFYATTNELFGRMTGGADFDTKLMLWTADGTPVMANEAHPGGPPFHSMVASRATWPGPGVYDPTISDLVQGDKYLLTITGFGDAALDATGARVFNTDRGFIDLWGPEGGAFASWGGVGDTGSYNIELGGATFCSVIPEPASSALLALGVIGLACVRKRRKA